MYWYTALFKSTHKYYYCYYYHYHCYYHHWSLALPVFCGWHHQHSLLVHHHSLISYSTCALHWRTFGFILWYTSNIFIQIQAQLGVPQSEIKVELGCQIINFATLIGGTHWALNLWHLTCRGLYQCSIPDYARRCRTSTLITIPINFWRNSDPFTEKKIFLAQKFTELEHFL